MMTSLKVILNTGRTLPQGQGKEYGKLSERYWKSVTICVIDPDDLKKLDVKDGQPVRITTESGSVLVRAAKSGRGPHPGRVFIPYGPWANVLIGSTTHGTGMPSFKGVQAVVEPAPSGEKVQSLRELLQTQYKEK